MSFDPGVTMARAGGSRFRQAFGKIRRFAFVHFRKSYVARQESLRVGECNQCGNCCDILLKCPFLIKQPEGSICSIYEDRPGQCGAFPIDESCLADVDFDCTYSFAEEAVVESPSSIPLLQIDSD